MITSTPPQLPHGAHGAAPASALPNATAIGATFSPSLVESAGVLLAKETKARNAVCLLAPTINIQRSPLGGRAFESFSEDPTLSGLTAAHYINGLQSENVSATIKHFVGNDQEHERMGEDSVIEQRALREIYLRPFQIAQAKSKPWAYMTSYNKLNGTHSSENKWLLTDLLRKEWGHDGLIMSDWYGTYSVDGSVNAGLNLEMPGRAIWRSEPLVKHLLMAHKIDPRQLDKVVGQTLTWVQKLAKLNQDVVYAAPSDEKTRTAEKEADAEILRRLGGEAIVVLKNQGEVLPITGQSKKVLVLGPNAKARVLTGGGSAQLKSSWSVSPYEGLVANKPDGVDLSYTLGASTSKFLPSLDEHFTCLDGTPGFDVAHYAIVDGKRADTASVTDKRDDSNLFMADFYHKDLAPLWITEIQAELTAPITGEYEFGMTVTGMGWLYVDEKLVVDASKEHERGTAFFGSGSNEIKGVVKVEKGKVGADGKRRVLTCRNTRSEPFTTVANPRALSRVAPLCKSAVFVSARFPNSTPTKLSETPRSRRKRSTRLSLSLA